MNRRTDNNYIVLKIPVGEYDFRVGVLNRFNKVSAWSDWENISVLKPIKPILESLTPRSIFIEKKENLLVIKAKNIYDATKLSLKSDDEQLALNHIKYIEPDTIHCEVNLSKARIGKYDLVLENPGNMVLIKKDYFTIGSIVKNMEAALNKLDFLTLAPNISYSQSLGENSAGLNANLGLGVDFYFKKVNYYNITPGLKFAYFNTTKEDALTHNLEGLRLDVFLSYLLPLKDPFVILFSIGAGLSSISLTSRDKNNSQNLYSRQSDLFVGVDIKYNMRRNVAIFFGTEFMILLDSGGGLCILTPRMGIMYSF
jgi:hypothetical protein